MIKFIVGLVVGVMLTVAFAHETFQAPIPLESVTAINDATYEKAKRVCEGSMGGLDKLEVHVIPNGIPAIAVVARCMSGNTRFTSP